MPWKWLKDFVNQFWTALKNVLTWVLDGLLSLISTVFSVLFDILSNILVTLLDSLGTIVHYTDYAAAWAGVPPQMLYVLNQCGFDTALTMLGGAFLARFLLNLIPAAFTRV